MNAVKATLLLLVTLHFAHATPVQAQTKEQVENAKNFAFGKINFSMTLDEFKKEFPFATKGKETNEKIDYYRFDIADPNKNASGVTVWFYDGKLLELAFTYDNVGDRKLNRIGGAKVLMQRLEAKFGQYDPLNVSDDRVKDVIKFWWPISQANRLIVLIDAAQFATINVGDTALQKSLDARKAKEADVGF
ncbi:MAG: hypothetical protein WCL32_07430 [Planctomycetota bacterium]